MKNTHVKLVAAAVLLTACAGPFVAAPPMMLSKPASLSAVILPIQDDSDQLNQADVAKAPADSAARGAAKYTIKYLDKVIAPDLAQSGLFTSIAAAGSQADVVIQPTLKAASMYALGGAANMRDVHHVRLEIVVKKNGQEVLRHTYDKNFEVGIGMFSGVPMLDKAWHIALGKMMQDIRTDLAQAIGAI